MATAATQSPQLTSDCSSNSASPEPAVPVVQSSYRIQPGSGGRRQQAGSDPPNEHANVDEDTDTYEELDPKSDYSSDHEPIRPN